MRASRLTIAAALAISVPINAAPAPRLVVGAKPVANKARAVEREAADADSMRSHAAHFDQVFSYGELGFQEFERRNT